MKCDAFPIYILMEYVHTVHTKWLFIKITYFNFPQYLGILSSLEHMILTAQVKSSYKMFYAKMHAVAFAATNV